MALEAFLINPPRGMKQVRRRRNVEAGFYDEFGFHPIRSSHDYDPGRAGEGKRVSHRTKPRTRRAKVIGGKVAPWVKKAGWEKRVPNHSKSSRRRTRGRGNPLGEEVIILNPRGKRVKRRRRTRLGNPKRRVYKRRRVRAANPVRKRVYKRRRVRAANSVRRRHNPRQFRRRRNPAIETALGYGFGDLAKLAIVGAAASIATTAIPRALGLTDEYKKYLGQAGVAIGGGLIVSQLVKKEYGGIWAVAGLAVIVADVMRQYVLARLGLPGLAAYPAELAGYPSEYYLSDGSGYPMVPTMEMYDSEQVF